jgi:predicted PolB exonuclease-like 3'-5' exonuclease
LDADAWLRTIESKFALLTIPCADSNKAHFAAQQLHGAARIWWDTFCAMQTDGHAISWEEFRNAFRAHHIPEGLIERKLTEFLALTQGTRTVLQYAQAFNHLCQYAGYHADNDAKKQDHFRRGLNTKLKEHLNLVKANTFSELVNMALTQEDCITAHRAEKKQRISSGPTSIQPLQYQLVQNAPPRAPQ